MGTRSRRFPWPFSLFLFLLPSITAAWSGKVVGVIDGDSITVLHDGRQEQIRLWGIDCPENHQDFGTKAKEATSILVFAKVAEVEPVTTDRYGRTVALVKVGDTLVNEELIRQGLAWVYTRYCDRPIFQEWKKLEEEARKAATCRGHQLETRWVLSLAFGRSRQSLRCGACGMHTIIFLDPEPNETGIRGRAVTLNCPGEE